MENGISNKSIKFRFRMTMVIILIIMTVIFLYSNRMKDKIIEEYNTYMDISVHLSNLSLKFSNRWVIFDSCYREKDDELRNAYVRTNAEIQEIMRYVRPYVNEDKHSSTYLRNLIRMNCFETIH